MHLNLKKVECHARGGFVFYFNLIFQENENNYRFLA